VTDEDPIDGRAHCGVAQRGHAQRHTVAAGWHVWEKPDERLLHRRMQFRRLTRAIARNLKTQTVKET
jgi:hypothetical protein